MTASPPPPGPWGAQPGAPAHGQQPPAPPPPGYPQQGYPVPPPGRGGGTKWLILAALVAVMAVAAAVTVVVLHSDSGQNSKGSTAAASDVASANDKGPVAVVTQDPTCASWGPIQNTIAEQENNGWDKRDPRIPAASWTRDQRSQYEAVAQAMRSAADQTVRLAKSTPHRVMRELYEQSIAYWRAYADQVAKYVAFDDHLAVVANDTSNALGAICESIRNGAAVDRAALVAPAPAPSQVGPLGDPSKPQQFLTSTNSECAAWKSALKEFDAANPDWQGFDPNIPAGRWTPQQKEVVDNVIPALKAYADKLEQIGNRSGNPVIADFAVLSGEYRRAFVQSLPTYGTADSWLASTANSLVNAIKEACSAAGG